MRGHAFRGSNPPKVVITQERHFSIYRKLTCADEAAKRRPRGFARKRGSEGSDALCPLRGVIVDCRPGPPGIPVPSPRLPDVLAFLSSRDPATSRRIFEAGPWLISRRLHES